MNILILMGTREKPNLSLNLTVVGFNVANVTSKKRS